MNLAFLLERPSQFDAPLFRFAASDPRHRFEAWFLDGAPGSAVVDPELGRTIDWGEDRLAGYESRIVPRRNAAAWFTSRLGGVDGPSPTLLIVNGYTRRPYLRAALAARKRGVSTALRIDTVLFPDSKRPSLARRILVRFALARLFDRFLTTGSAGESFLAACGVRAAAVGRFPYAVDHERFERGANAARARRSSVRAALGLPADATVVLALAKFSPREAPRDLLAARSRIEEPAVWWVLAGDGPQRPELEAAVRERRLDRTLFPGYVPYPRLPELYAAADLFVHPASEERWGVSVAEALASGLPVVASDRVGAGFDLVVPGENGERYRSGDGGELAAAIARALRLDVVRVARTSVERLRPFGIPATWESLIAAASAAGGGAQ